MIFVVYLSQANKTEIDQSTKNILGQIDWNNPYALSTPWIEVGEDDQLFYIWVDKRDPEKGYYLGSGELEISLKKSDLVGKYDENGMKLKEFAGPEGRKELKDTLDIFWMLLTQEYNGKYGNGVKITHYNENVRVGFNGDDPVAWLESGSYKLPGNSGSKSQKIFSSSPNKNSKSVEEQVRRYIEQNDILRLTLYNDKLIVEYNTAKKKEIEIDSEKLKAVQNWLKEHDNSIRFDQLQVNSNYPASQPSKPDYTLWIVGGAGLILIIGVFVYWVRKRKVKKVKS